MIVRWPLLAGAVVLGMATAIVAAADNAKSIVGVWEKTNGKAGKTPVRIEFTKDGKLKVNRQIGDSPDSYYGTYKLKDTSLVVVFTLGSLVSEGTFKIVKLDEKVLHIQQVKGDDSKDVDEFKRVIKK